MPRSRSLAGLVERLSHCTYGEAYRNGLNPAQWSALRYFANANRFSRTASAFARYQGITLGAASQTIGALVDKCLLGRTRDETDKRRYNLALSAKAEKLICTDPIRALVAAAFELGEAERAATAEALEKMLMHLMRHTGGAHFGYCRDCRFLRGSPGDSYVAKEHRCTHWQQGLNDEDLKKICVNFGLQELPSPDEA